MGATGFKPSVSLLMEEGGARLTDSETGRSVALTELEGRVLDLFSGQSADQLAGQAQHAGIGLWPDQVRAVLERAEANGFLLAPLENEIREGPALLPTDVVPRFRSDLSLTKAPGSRSAVQVVDPVTQQAFSLFDFEASIARMLNGSRSVSEVIDLAAKIGIPVTPDSLDRFLRQLRSFGFLDATGTAAPATAWDPRRAWPPEVREMFQSALRLMRSGHPQQAISYINTILTSHPDLDEVLDLQARAEAALLGVIDSALPFDQLHGGAAAAPPPPPDEDLPEIAEDVPPPKVPKLEGLGLLPAPPPSAPPKTLPLPARSTLMFGAPPLNAKTDSALPVAPKEAEAFGNLPTEPARVLSPPPVLRPHHLDSPPRASPPPRGLEPLSEPMTGGSVRAEFGSEPVATSAPAPELEPEPPSVQVDAAAFIPETPRRERDAPVEERASAKFSALTEDAGLPAAAVAPESIPEFTPTREPVVVPRRGKGLIAVAVLVTAAAGSMLIPVPRSVEVSCALSPVILGEPHADADGEVSELVVKNGDVVRAGTVLVRVTVPNPPEAEALAEKAKAARAKIEKYKAAAKTSPKAKKAAAAVAKADKELAKAKAALPKTEPKKPTPAQVKAKKAVEAKQKARDKAQAQLDVENATAQRDALEIEARAADEKREKLVKEAPGSTITAPVDGRFDAPAKHAVGMGLKASERFGRIVDPGMWKVTAEGLPASTDPASGQVHVETGRIFAVTNGTLSGEGPLRNFEGNVLLTDDSAAAGKPVLHLGAGNRMLGSVLLSKARR